MAYSTILLFVVLLSSLEILALRNTEIIVPEAVRVGDSVTLRCNYDLESVALYTIKWYRYSQEFYRYVPKESPPAKVFDLPHLDVDPTKSNSMEVTLRNVDQDTSGEFKCEVSADGPLFHTDIRSANLLVADIQEEEPVLRTEQQKVAAGDEVRANCTTPGSNPRMNVTWFINDVEVIPNEHLQVRESVSRYEALPGLETVRSTILIKTGSDSFKNNKMRLKCLATMFSLYKNFKETEIQDDAPKLALIMEPTTHSKEGTSGGQFDSAHFSLITFTIFGHLFTWLRRKVFYLN